MSLGLGDVYTTSSAALQTVFDTRSYPPEHYISLNLFTNGFA